MRRSTGELPPVYGAPRSVGRKRSSPDVLLAFAALALALVGLVMVASASAPLSYDAYRHPGHLFAKQATAALVGCVLLAALACYDYRRLFRYDALLLLAASGLTFLTLVPALAPAGLWLRLGPISFQPTEFLKLSLVVYMAAALVRKEARGELDNFALGVLPFLMLLGLLAAIALAQPDFALVVIFGAIGAFLLLVAGVRLSHLCGPLLAGIPLFLGVVLLSPYHRARLMTFLNPLADPRGDGYHLLQSFVALGSGGPFGLGLGASREKWLYLPSAYNDFILSIIGEELGLIGVLLVLALFALLAWRGFRAAVQAPDHFGFLLASGLTFALALQAGINFAVVVGALPVTGLTLPLVSYGGSSLVVSFMMIGILLNISRYARDIQRTTKGAGIERLGLRRRDGGASLSRPRRGRSAPSPLW